MKGVFTHDGIKKLIRAGRIVTRAHFNEEHINNASLDLTIDDEAYEVACVVKPQQGKEAVRDLLPLMGATHHKIERPFQRGKSYLVRASVDINFPPGIFARANAKSTSGRLFLQSRLLVDRIDAFDSIDVRHQGITAHAWLVIEPLCFDIAHATTERYLQLKIYNKDARLGHRDLLTLMETQDLLYRKDTQTPYTQGDLIMHTHDGTLLMTLFAQGTESIGYRARKHVPSQNPISLSARSIEPDQYFLPIFAEQRVLGDNASWGVWLEAGEHYLLTTNEMIRLPDGLSATLRELDSRHGDAVVHFAGFIDPGFFGAITLEVRSPRRVFLRHGSPIATVMFERMQGNTFRYDGSYHSVAGTKLPKQFKSL